MRQLYVAARYSIGDRGGGVVSDASGNALFLVFRDRRYNIQHAWAGIVGKDGIKENILYILNANGQPEIVR
jgi:hypothetical protein